jgi:hypothetical protein
VKHVARIALGLAVMAPFVYGFHWVGLLTVAHSGLDPKPLPNPGEYILVTLWGLITSLVGAFGVLLGVGIAHSIGDALIREKKEPDQFDPL